MTSKYIPGNAKLRYWYEPTYHGYPLMVDKGPFIEQQLAKLLQTMEYALDDYRSVFAFRVDLNLPSRKLPSSRALDDQEISRFAASLQAKIDWDRSRVLRRAGSAHRCSVRNFWVREIASTSGKAHYHCVVFLNWDAYCSLGLVDSSEENMISRLRSAWATALGISQADVVGLVHFPTKGSFHLRRKDRQGLDKFIMRCSYLCKAATKGYGNGHHSYGGTRC